MVSHEKLPIRIGGIPSFDQGYVWREAGSACLLDGTLRGAMSKPDTIGRHRTGIESRGTILPCCESDQAIMDSFSRQPSEQQTLLFARPWLPPKICEACVVRSFSDTPFSGLGMVPPQTVGGSCVLSCFFGVILRDLSPEVQVQVQAFSHGHSGQPRKHPQLRFGRSHVIAHELGVDFQ